jgi:uncharacterized membrane protein
MHTRGNVVVLATPTIVALGFFYFYAWGYLVGEPARFGIYLPRRQWLTIHILTGAAALLLGPLQLWLGLNRRTEVLHRMLGVLYVTGVASGATTAFYLAKHTDFGWLVGLGLGSMAFVWVVTTALGTISICRGLVQQHREWMIRSYVVTCGFVTFRVLSFAFDFVKGKPLIERMAAAAWLAWSAPLFVTEVILQGRRVFEKKKPIEVPQPEKNVENAEPELTAFGLHSSESTYLRHP